LHIRTQFGGKGLDQSLQVTVSLFHELWISTVIFGWQSKPCSWVLSAENKTNRAKK
jgi:hypothetical protein